MAIHDLFSKRQKRALKDTPDVYSYSKIPPRLRVQIWHILCDAHGEFAFNHERTLFPAIENSLCRELGKLALASGRSSYERVKQFLIADASDEEALDLIELTFQYIDSVRESGAFSDARLDADAAIADLNVRFKENGLGYEFGNGQLIRIDSTLLHSEVVKPALSVLCDPRFESAEKEFLDAFEHYRHARYDSALNEALKAFESTMKIIISIKGWKYQQKDTAKTLLETLFKEKLIPEFTQSHFAALRATLEAGVPTMRNKLSGHGKGESEFKVEPHMVSYALHLTASNIVFLAAAAGIA